MSEEAKSGSLAQIFGEVRAKTKEQDNPAASFAPNRALIRERSLAVVETLRLDCDLKTISAERVEIIRARIGELVDKDEAPLRSQEKGLLLQEVLDEVFGFGPLGPLLRDPSVQRLCVNGPNNVYAERQGKFQKTDVFFENARHLRQTIDKIIQPLGLQLDKNCPSVTAHLPNGSPVEATIPPVSIDGATLSIELLGNKIFSIGQLVEKEVLSREMAELLKAYARARVNITISGPVDSGRLVLLSALSAHIAPSDRLISVEDRVELRLQHEHWVRLQAVPPDSNGQGAVSVRSLLQLAHRMCPDRIVLTQCQGAEGYDFLQSLNEGRSGDITKVTARSPSDCLRRFENMVRHGDPGMPPEFIRDLIANTMQVIVQTERQADGKYKISEIVEMAEFDGNSLRLSTMHRLQRQAPDQEGVVKYTFVDCEEKSRFI